MVRTTPFSGSMPAMRPNDPRNPKPAVDLMQQFQQNYQRQIMQMNYPQEYAAAMEDQKAQEQRDRESQKRIGNPVGGVTTVGLMAGPGRELSSIGTWGKFSMEREPQESSPFAPGAGYQATDPSDPYYSKTPRRPMRLAEGGLFSTPLPGYAMGGPVMRDYGMGGAGGRDYGMGGPGGRDYGMGGAGMRGYAMGGLVEPPPGLKGGLGQMQPNGQYLRPQRKPDFMINQGYAEGGPVEGPGGPKDDLINAKLSDGEFVMPSEVVEFYGLDRLHKMMAKAKEGLNEIKPAPQALPTPLPVTMPQPTPAFAYGGMAQSMPVPGYKLGGQFDEEESPTDAMDPLPQAIAAQQRAVEANQNPSFLDYYFPTEGVEASQAASSATQQANDALGEFFDEEAVKDYYFRAKSQNQKILMEENRLLNDPAWVQANPGHYNQIIKQYKKDLNYTEQPMAGPQRLTAVVGDQAYGPTLNDSPAFQPRPAAPAVAAMQQPQNIIRRLPPNPYSVGPGYSLTPMDPVAPAPPVSPSPSPEVPFVADPATLAAMRSRRADLRAGQPLLTAPEGLLAQGRAVLDALPTAQAPMDVPLMRPAPLTMTEKEQQAKPISRSRTPEANPEFEAALAGLTGMQKRRARQGLQMEEATNQRNQARADIAQAEIDARNERIRVQNLQDTRDNYRIQHQFAQARFNEQLGANAALDAAKTQEEADREAAQQARPMQGVPILNPDGTVSQTHYSVNRMILPFQTAEPPPEIRMEPVPGTNGQFVPMLGKSRVSGMPIYQRQTQPGPFREGLGRTSYTPVIKPAPEERRYIDPESNRTITLKPGEQLPEGSTFVPLTPEAAPAPTGQRDPAALRQKYGYGK